MSLLMHELILIVGVLFEILDYVTVCNHACMYRVVYQSTAGLSGLQKRRIRRSQRPEDRAVRHSVPDDGLTKST